MFIHRRLLAIAASALLLAGCTGSPRNTPDSPLAEANVLERLDLGMEGARFERRANVPVAVQQIHIDPHKGVQVDGEGLTWYQQEMIRLDRGPEFLSTRIFLSPLVTEKFSGEEIDKWLVDRSVEERIEWKDSQDGNDQWRHFYFNAEFVDVPPPPLYLDAVFRRVPPRGPGRIFEIVGRHGGEYELVEGDPFLDYLTARYLVRLKMPAVVGGHSPRYSDESALRHRSSAPLATQFQVIASTSRRWQPDDDDPTDCLVWASEEDSEDVEVGNWNAKGIRRVRLHPRVLARMLRWPVSEFQVLARSQPRSGSRWEAGRSRGNPDQHRNVLIATITREQVAAAYAEFRAKGD